MTDTPTHVGTEAEDIITGRREADSIVGLGGDDRIDGGKGADVIYGDYTGTNLLEGIQGATSFAQYGQSSAWRVQSEAGGHTSMSQTVDTVAGTNYEISFELAANYGAGVVSGAVEVLWNGAVVAQFNTNDAIFEDFAVNLAGTGGPGELTFRSIDAPSDEDAGPTIHTDAPIYYYEKEVTIGGQPVDVRAFAPGQANIYQVVEGQLYKFDPETEEYTAAGAQPTVVINAIGFNVEDDMIYGIAVGNGVDALGNTVTAADLMMVDAAGNSYRVGDVSYKSWTADFDENGNLWSFHSSMDRVTKIDVDNLDENGDPVEVTYKFPKSMVTDKLWDVAYDADSQTFYGIAVPRHEGDTGKLYEIDISAVADGGEPVFTVTDITTTLVDGQAQDGIPKITFGAFIIDGDGNLYAGGNGGDHDMDDDTGISGGIYRVDTDADTGTATLVLVSDAPRAYSNDGTADPRAMDPFTQVDRAAQVLIRAPELIEVADPSDSYDDTINGEQAADIISGGLGEDTLIGSSAGDTLSGDVGDDALYGGAGPDWQHNGLISVYDDDGNRFDQFGNPLPEDDDTLLGGDGADFLHGSAGHDVLDGGADNDTLDGGTGHDTLLGGSGDDALSGGRENDSLSGGDGNDTLDGGSGTDTLAGDAGDDILTGGRDNDILSGGDGDDTMDGGSHDDDMSGGAGADAMIGGSGDDTMRGGDGADNIKGGSGADTIFGDADNDTIDGGTGDDVIDGGAGKDSIKGGSGSDTISGGDGNDYISAYTGDDVIDGGAGKDKIAMGAGADTITGGLGSDKFVFRAADMDGSTNVITDLTHAGAELDVIDLRALHITAQDVSLTYEDHGVTLSIGDTIVRLNDHNDLGETDFVAQVSDSLLF